MTGLFTNTTLSASALNDAINSLTLNAISSAGYTLVLADAGKLVTLSHASSQNLTIPLNATVAYATGTVIETLTIGAGTWTVVPTGGVTYSGPTSLPTGTRLRLTKTGTDTWYGSVLGGGGLTFITSSTFNAVSSVSVNSCFTTAYDSYHVRLMLTAASGTDAVLSTRLRVSAADNSTTNYTSERLFQNSTTVTGAENPVGVSNTQWYTGSVNTGAPQAANYMLDFFGPATAVHTTFMSRGTFRSSTLAFWQESIGGVFAATTTFDGFSLIASTGTISGTLRIYGLQN